MIELAAVFWIGTTMFAVIGLMRGWTQEILVTASIILALFMLDQFGVYVIPMMVNTTGVSVIATDPEVPLRRAFMFKTAILLIVTFFGYQGPMVAHFVSRGRVKSKVRETFQEGLLGLLIGGVNGYFVLGTLWYYLHTEHYPFPWVISPENFPQSTSFAMLKYLPLQYLGQGPALEVLIVVIFLFMIIALV